MSWVTTPVHVHIYVKKSALCMWLFSQCCAISLPLKCHVIYWSNCYISCLLSQAMLRMLTSCSQCLHACHVTVVTLSSPTVQSRWLFFLRPSITVLTTSMSPWQCRQSSIVMIVHKVIMLCRWIDADAKREAHKVRVFFSPLVVLLLEPDWNVGWVSCDSSFSSCPSRVRHSVISGTD